MRRLSAIFLSICVSLSFGGHAVAALVSTAWNGDSLMVQWDDEDDLVMFTQQDGFLQIHDNLHADVNDPGKRLLSDAGEPIPTGEISLASFFMGGGNDNFLNSHFPAGRIIVDGGLGDDFLNAPSGNQAAVYLFGGPGTNDFEGDVGQDLHIFGGPDNDTIIGGRGGMTYIDAGEGTNTIQGWGDTMTTYVHRPGAANVIGDGGGDSNYLLAPGTTPSELGIFDFGGVDHLVTLDRPFVVDGTTIVSDSISGVFWGADDIEHGASTISTASSSSGVPEPNACILALIIACGAACALRRTLS